MKNLKDSPRGSACVNRLLACRALIAAAQQKPETLAVDVGTLSDVDQNCIVLSDTIGKLQGETADHLETFNEILNDVDAFCTAIEKDIQPILEGVPA
jgi:uncharacterized protein YfcZ (UPF0381/DUF406 family)